MSLAPPPPERSEIGDTWVDPITADRYEFLGDESIGTYGWVNVGSNPELSRPWTSVEKERERG